MRPLPSRLVATLSSEQPPPDEIRLRWRRRPLLALSVRAVTLLGPLAAAVIVGIVASRQFRPQGLAETVLWALWTAATSLLTLWLVDILARRLLPLHRLLQLCLAYPDRAPSRLRVAVRAARPRRPEALLARADAGSSATVVAEQVVTLLAALTLHDRRTRGHSVRVCAFTNLVAAQMKLPPQDEDRLTWVALVHDIGKLDVPSRLLNKPDKPTFAEWQLLKTHPERGAAFTAPMREWLGPWADAVLQHHERYDGGGYPAGIAGEEISLAARIIAVTDAFEVMTAPRAYRRPVDAQTARAELARHAGTQFDPEVVRHFLAVGLPQLRRAIGPFAWLAEIPFISSWPRLEAAASTTAAHAVTVTAAASAAGVLAVGGASAASPAQATAPTSVDDVVITAPAAVDGAATPAPGSVTTVSERVAHQAPKQRPARTSTTAPGWGSTRARAAGAAAPAKRQATPRVELASHQSPGHDGNAYGHARAPGWQKNWGENGRQPGHR